MKKMKISDCIVVALMYGFCIWWGIMNSHLNEESQIYPWFCILLLAGLTTLHLIRMIYCAVKSGVENDFGKVFKGFMPKQFFVVLAAIIAYFVFMSIIGFYPATLIFMFSVLLFLKVSFKASALTTIIVMLLIYCAFTKFLGVRLPMGSIFG